MEHARGGAATAAQGANGDPGLHITEVGDTMSLTRDGSTQVVPLEPAVVERLPWSPSALLHPRSAALPLVGLDELRAELVAWCHDGEPFGVRVVLGPSGAGKTRLGVQVCQDCTADGWLAGFLRSSDDLEAWEALATAPCPRLVVTEAAEDGADRLGVVRSMMAAGASPEHPVRVVVLTRTAPQAGGDGRALGAPGGTDAVLAGSRLDVLADLDSPARAALWAAARDVFASRLGIDAAGAGVAGCPELEGELFARPLMVVIAAYLGLHGPVPATREAMLEDLLVHEDRYWQAAAGQVGLRLDQRQRRQAVALTAVAGAETEDDVLALLRRLSGFADASHQRCAEVARWAHGLYADPHRWNRFGTDAVAEHLFTTTCVTPDVLAALVTDRAPAALAGPLTFLARAARERPDLHPTIQPIVDECLVAWCRAAVEDAPARPGRAALEVLADVLAGRGALAPTLAAVTAALPPEPGRLASALAELPRRAGAVGHLGAGFQERLTAHLRLRAEMDGAFLPELAASLQELSWRLRKLDRPEEGVAVLEEAVAVWRRLAEREPAHLAELAGALRALSDQLPHCGLRARRVEAVAAAEEAAAHLRGLAEADGTYAPQLAAALDELSSRLAGRWPEQALRAGEEAVAVWRRLAESDPAHLPDLAASLRHLSNARWDHHQGRRSSAESLAPQAPLDVLAPAEEAVAIARRLAEPDPAHLPELAAALENLSSVSRGHAGLAGPGPELDQALVVAEEAVAVWRRVGDGDPAALPNLAHALERLRDTLGHDRRRGEEQLAAARDVVVVRRQLAEADPTELPQLAVSLAHLEHHLSSHGLEEEALAAVQEAVSIRRFLAQADPGSHLSVLSASLSGLASRFAMLGRLEEALAAADEAVAAHRRMADIDPAAGADHGLAGCLETRAELLAALGRREEASAACREAVGEERRADRTHREQERIQQAEFLVAQQDIVEHTRRLADADPDRYLAELASSLDTLAVFLGLDRREDADAARREALAIARRLAETDPAHLPGLAHRLERLSGELDRAGRPDRARAALEEVVAIRRRLGDDSREGRVALASSLEKLARHLRSPGERETADRIRREATDLRPTDEAGRRGHHREEASTAMEDASGDGCHLPDAEPTYPSGLAASLMNPACHIEEGGRPEDALAGRERAVVAREEEVARIRRLVEGDPSTHRRHLANALDDLARALAQLGRWERADALRLEAAALHQCLDALGERDETDPMGLGLAQRTLIRCLRGDGPLPVGPHQADDAEFTPPVEEELAQMEKELEDRLEAVANLRRLAAADPDYLTDLAESLCELPFWLSVLGRREELVAVVKEVIGLFRRLVDADPDAYRPQLGGMLLAHVQVLGAAGPWEEFVATVEEALAGACSADADPAHHAQIAPMLDEFSFQLVELGRRQEADFLRQAAARLQR